MTNQARRNPSSPRPKLYLASSETIQRDLNHLFWVMTFGGFVPASFSFLTDDVIALYCYHGFDLLSAINLWQSFIMFPNNSQCDISFYQEVNEWDFSIGNLDKTFISIKETCSVCWVSRKEICHDEQLLLQRICAQTSKPTAHTVYTILAYL